MRFSIAVAAILGGLQAASALKLSPRNAVEREEQVGAFSSVLAWCLSQYSDSSNS
jgi:hypothetical protein